MAVDATEAKFTFEEVEDRLEISSESGVIMVCKVGEGQTALPVGSVVLTQMLGVDGIDVFEKHIPIEIFWTNLALWKHSPGYVYWLHPVDYDAAVRRPMVRASVVPAIGVAAIVPSPRNERASGARGGLPLRCWAAYVSSLEVGSGAS
jgi:hypothetical protein